MAEASTPPELPPELVRDYLIGMRAVIAQLVAIADRLSAAGHDREALAQLQRETHKIHGSAGSFGFPVASRLAAGMEVTVKDWVSRPDDRDVDRGSLTQWFVTRLAEMLELEVPRRAAVPRRASRSPPRLILRRPSAPPPAAPVERPPETPRTTRLVMRRPSTAPRDAPPPPPPFPPPQTPAAPPTPHPKRPVVAPRKAADPATPPTRPPPPISPAPTAPPPEQPPPVARTQELPWLIPPDGDSVEITGPPAATAPQPPPSEAAPPPVVEPQPQSAPAPPEPQAAAPTAGPPPETPAVTAASEARPESAIPELIVVEDDPALAELLEFGLRARGYRFLSYRNGRDALRDLRALDVGGTRPLVLLDVDLPGLDGYSVLDALERDRPGVYRVVFTTVHGTETEQLRGLEAGALDYLVKPISLRVALEKIRRWVGR